MEEVIPASGPTQWGCPFSRKEEGEEEGRHGVGRTHRHRTRDLGPGVLHLLSDRVCREGPECTCRCDRDTGHLFRGRYCAVFSNNYLTLSSKIWCPGLHPSPYLLLGVWQRDGAFAVLRFASGEGEMLVALFLPLGEVVTPSKDTTAPDTSVCPGNPRYWKVSKR